jgi:hypothetical protein
VVSAALLAAPGSWAALASYNQNFEGLNAGSGTALSGVGFQVAGNVFDGNTGATPPYGNFKFFYGNFPAPNGTGAFSTIAGGEGGALQGTKYLNAFSDYNCCSPNQGHFDTSAPFDYVQSSVFQEQFIGAADIGSTWTLTFDAKLPSSNGCEPAAAADCIAFIRTIDPNTGNAQRPRARRPDPAVRIHEYVKAVCQHRRVLRQHRIQVPEPRHGCRRNSQRHRQLPQRAECEPGGRRR